MAQALSKLVEQAARPLTEAQVRSLMLAKIRAEDVYVKLLMAPTATMTDDEKINHRFQLERARDAFYTASAALQA